MRGIKLSLNKKSILVIIIRLIAKIDSVVFMLLGIEVGIYIYAYVHIAALLLWRHTVHPSVINPFIPHLWIPSFTILLRLAFAKLVFAAALRTTSNSTALRLFLFLSTTLAVLASFNLVLLLARASIGATLDGFRLRVKLGILLQQPIVNLQAKIIRVSESFDVCLQFLDKLGEVGIHCNR